MGIIIILKHAVKNFLKFNHFSFTVIKNSFTLVENLFIFGWRFIQRQWSTRVVRVFPNSAVFTFAKIRSKRDLWFPLDFSDTPYIFIGFIVLYTEWIYDFFLEFGNLIDNLLEVQIWLFLFTLQYILISTLS